MQCSGMHSISGDMEREEKFISVIFEKKNFTPNADYNLYSEFGQIQFIKNYKEQILPLLDVANNNTWVLCGGKPCACGIRSDVFRIAHMGADGVFCPYAQGRDDSCDLGSGGSSGRTAYGSDTEPCILNAQHA